MTDPGAQRAAGHTRLLAGLCLLLAAWIVWLRSPAFSTPVWNVDVAITAAIADEILAGGVPYRDATDLRAPLTYYFYAAVFAVAGPNNLDAIHAAHTALIIAIALLVLLTGRRLGGGAAAGWSAWVYAGLACTLFSPLDNFALHTEWPLALGSALGAWLYLTAPERNRGRRLVAAGAGYGLAVLSKQPALLDLGAPLALQAALLWAHRAGDFRRHLRDTLCLLLGFAAPLVLTAAWFAARGAFADLVFYTWTYNTRYYVPEVPLGDRLPTVAVPLRLLHSFAPSLAGLLGCALLLTAWNAARWRDDRAGRAVFAPLWLLGGLAASTLSGRGFEHYSIQLLAPAALVAGQLLGAATDWIRSRLGRRDLTLAPALLLAGALAAVVVVQARHAVAYRAAVRPHDDPAVPMARIVRELTTRADRIFVWGFYADFYPLADRLPASRFVHGSFLTGLIPWTNLGRDTSYAVVPGSMDALLADLGKHRPRLIIDASPSLNRRFQDYPPEKFPRFAAYLREHYVEIDPHRSEPAGWFRFHLRRDSVVAPFAAEPPPAPGLATTLVAIETDFSGAARVVIHGSDTAGELTQLGLWIGRDDYRVVSLPPSRERLLVVPVPAGASECRLVARTRDGRSVVSPPLSWPDRGEAPPALQLQSPTGPITADGLASIHRPQPVEMEGQPGWLCHAYTALRFPLPTGRPRQLHVGYGLAPGAYADANAATDGVEFIVQLQPRSGRPVVLHRRLLRPASNPADRGMQSTAVTVPAAQPGDSLVLVTHPGPAHSQAYDWSYWSGLRLDPVAAASQ